MHISAKDNQASHGGGGLRLGAQFITYMFGPVEEKCCALKLEDPRVLKMFEANMHVKYLIRLATKFKQWSDYQKFLREPMNKPPSVDLMDTVLTDLYDRMQSQGIKLRESKVRKN